MKTKTPAHARTILVAEDSVDILELLEALLSTSQHTVLPCACAEDALNLWEKHGPDIDLVITDVRLGKSGSGLDLAERLLALKPSLKVLTISGYLEPEHFHGGRQRLEFLQKPFTFAELQARVEALLAASAPWDYTCQVTHPSLMERGGSGKSGLRSSSAR